METEVKTKEPIKKRSCTPNTDTQLHPIKDFLRKSGQCKSGVQIFAGGLNLFGLWFMEEYFMEKVTSPGHKLSFK